MKEKAPVVVIIHEIFGLCDWAKEMADELAGEGFIVIAPDLLSGFGPNGGGSSEFPSQDATVKAVSGLDPAQACCRSGRGRGLGKHVPAGNGKIRGRRFLLGRWQVFRVCDTSQRSLRCICLLWPGAGGCLHGDCSCLWFYAGNDARIGATVPDTTAAMKAAGKIYEPVTYDGAGHGFMRAGEDPTNTNPANKTATRAGFARLVQLLHEMKSAQASICPQGLDPLLNPRRLSGNEALPRYRLKSKELRSSE